MTLSQNVKDAVKEFDAVHDQRFAPWRGQWQTIRAHLLSQDAEIERLQSGLAAADAMLETTERTLERCKQTLDTTSECWRLDSERLEAAERDARRWRHVRSTAFREFELDHVWLRFAAIEQFDGPIHPLTEAWIDESVDRRIAAAQEGAG